MLELLNEEPGAARVARHVGEGVISPVNAAEVIGKLVDAGLPEDDATRALDMLALDTVDFDARLAASTGALRASTRALGLSLGDRACIATASALGVAAVTADRRWAGIDIGVTVDLVR